MRTLAQTLANLANSCETLAGQLQTRLDQGIVVGTPESKLTLIRDALVAVQRARDTLREAREPLATHVGLEEFEKL